MKDDPSMLEPSGPTEAFPTQLLDVHAICEQRDRLERENAKLTEENVKANGLLDMAMKREAKLREELANIQRVGGKLPCPG